MNDFQQEVIDRLGRIEEQNKTLFNRITVMEKAMNGNGQPGLLTRVASLELNWRWAKWLTGVIGAGVGYVIAHFTKN